MEGRGLALLLIGVGFAAVLVGLLVWLGWLSWFGRLPGDIRIETENAKVYIPITSMILVSVALSAALYLVRRVL